MEKYRRRPGPTLPLTLLLKLNKALKTTLFSKKFYMEVDEKILSKTGPLDRNLYFICYFTLLLSSVLNNQQKIKAFLTKHTRHLIAVVRSLVWPTPPKPVKGLDTPTKEAEAHEQTTKSVTAECLKNVSSYLSDIRIFNRLVEAIKYTPWIIDEYQALTSQSAVPRLDRLVNLLQALNCLALELFENIGWLTDHNWVKTGDNNWWCIETYIWSSRVWGAYILIEIIELFRRTPASKRNKDWRIQLFKQLVQLPLVLHWSLYDGCLTPFWVGLCGLGASYFDFIATWKSLDLE